MSVIEDFKKFVQKRVAQWATLVKELEAIGKSELTIDGAQLSIGGQSLTFRVDVERRAAWSIYIELATRITARPLNPEHGLLREALSSMHAIFAIVRETLKQAGPAVARGPESLGAYSVRLLNEELAPFMAEWHAKLADWEHQRPPNIGPVQHEHAWPEVGAMRDQLMKRRETLVQYVEALRLLAGLEETDA